MEGPTTDQCGRRDGAVSRDDTRITDRFGAVFETIEIFRGVPAIANQLRTVIDCCSVKVFSMPKFGLLVIGCCHFALSFLLV